MGGLNPTLEALARKLTPGGSGDRQLARPTPSPAEVSESGGDLIIVNLDLARILAMPLDQFACEGRLLEVRVPWLDVTLWFVPDERDAEALGREGVSRGRVWTADELMPVMSMLSRTDVVVRVASIAKAIVVGEVVEATTRDRGCSSPGTERARPWTGYLPKGGVTPLE